MTQKANFKNNNLTISGLYSCRKGLMKQKKYSALVVSHPAGGVKE